MTFFERIEPQPPALKAGFEWQMVETPEGWQFSAARPYSQNGFDEEPDDYVIPWDTLTPPYRVGDTKPIRGDCGEIMARRPITAIAPVQVDGVWVWEISTGDVK